MLPGGVNCQESASLTLSSKNLERDKYGAHDSYNCYQNNLAAECASCETRLTNIHPKSAWCGLTFEFPLHVHAIKFVELDPNFMF